MVDKLTETPKQNTLHCNILLQPPLVFVYYIAAKLLKEEYRNSVVKRKAVFRVLYTQKCLCASAVGGKYGKLSA